MTRLGGDYFISHEIRISNETTRIQWKVRGFFFVAHLDLQSGINSHILGFATCKMLGKSSTKWWWKMVMIYHGTSSKKPPKHESRHIICLYMFQVPGPPPPPCHGHGHNINPPPPCGMGGSWEGGGGHPANSNATGRIRWRKLISSKRSMYAEISYMLRSDIES